MQTGAYSATQTDPTLLVAYQHKEEFHSFFLKQELLSKSASWSQECWCSSILLKGIGSQQQTASGVVFNYTTTFLNERCSRAWFNSGYRDPPMTTQTRQRRAKAARFCFLRPAILLSLSLEPGWRLGRSCLNRAHCRPDLNHLVATQVALLDWASHSPNLVGILQTTPLSEAPACSGYPPY